jgi:hypothetical protein
MFRLKGGENHEFQFFRLATDYPVINMLSLRNGVGGGGQVMRQWGNKAGRGHVDITREKRRKDSYIPLITRQRSRLCLI